MWTTIMRITIMRIAKANDHVRVKAPPAMRDESQTTQNVKCARVLWNCSRAGESGWSAGERAYLLRRARFAGTFFPFLRALDSPIAIACLRLFTLPPLPPGPLLAVPRL
jgi:hypothetical protein